jgi:hypothetical protein
MVILYKQTLNEKVNQFINDNHIETLTSDPTQKMQRQIQNTLKQSNTLFKKNKKTLMLQMNPAAPTLGARVKIHKPQAPIRPVINNITAPSYCHAFGDRRGIGLSTGFIGLHNYSRVPPDSPNY